MIQEAEIQIDNYSLAVIGIIALVAFWLVFSLVRRMFGLVLLAALAIGAWVLWNNPDMLQAIVRALPFDI